MVASLSLPRRAGLAVEWLVLFIVAPLVVYFHPTRWSVHGTLWVGTLYAAIILSRQKDFSWREAWRGHGLTARGLKLAALRFALSTLAIVGLTALIAPVRLFDFPVNRPGFWLLVMLLYPLLSALPQEVLFRVFFFRRYGPLFGEKALPWISAAIFGFIHIVFHNWVSPPLSFICGLFIAFAYARHKSLKLAALEHAIYGDMVFTVGLGLYFLVTRP
ncbi:MAG: CPBP family intramembrane metalloprotease [Alphaproteobacteria bacterium]|nr:CPBP family intramembrane metalloprotease [Alphaproteobacteria bacterium]